MSVMSPAAPPLSFVMTLNVTVGAPVEIGTVARGRRRVIPIVGGRFEGPQLRGRVLPDGADWQIVRADMFTELDARYVLETNDGSRIYVQNAGVRHAPADVMARVLAGEDVDPAQVYFRTAPAFETAAPDLQWLTRSLFVATGERHPTEVVINVFRVD